MMVEGPLRFCRAVLLTALAVAVSNDRSKTPLVLSRGQERADHASEISRVTIENVQPESIAAFIRVTAQIAKVLHRDETRIVNGLLKVSLLDYISQDQATTFVNAAAGPVAVDQIAASFGQIGAGVVAHSSQQRIDKRFCCGAGEVPLLELLSLDKMIDEGNSLFSEIRSADRKSTRLNSSHT